MWIPCLLLVCQFLIEKQPIEVAHTTMEHPVEKIPSKIPSNPDPGQMFFFYWDFALLFVVQDQK